MSSLVWPDGQWLQEEPQAHGWNASTLAQAQEAADQLGTTALMIVHNGVMILGHGAISQPTNIHSIRKSILSALFGIAYDQRLFSLYATLEELGVDDIGQLTKVEKQARIIDLLKARSGIYHPTLYETEYMLASKPARGAYPPGANFCYNNWDFNALGTIYKNITGMTVFEGFEKYLSGPLGMQDFDRARDTCFFVGPESEHPAYLFRLSARDLARFGWLFLCGGRWKDKEIVPADWVERSTTSYSVAEGDAQYGYSGYGYMWWVAANDNHYLNVALPQGSYSARGARGQSLLVVPAFNTVVIHRVNTDKDGAAVSSEQIGKLLDVIFRA